MGNKADLRRRGLGVIFVGLALAMLIAGETVLSGRFSKAGFLLYWLACLLFTFLAILVALLDTVVVRRRIRDAERALVEETLREVAREKAAKTKAAANSGKAH